MNLSAHQGRGWGLALMVVSSAFLLSLAHAQPGSADPKAAEIRIVSIIGLAGVEVLPPGANAWILTQTNQVLGPGYRLRTGAKSRVILRWSDQSVVRFGALTEIEILPPPAATAGSGLHLIRGLFSFFHREQPGRIRVLSRGTVAGVEGTEFVASAEVVNGIPRTTFSVIDGRVALANRAGALVLTNGQQAIVEAGRAPALQAAGFIVNNVLQWCLYYPAVLDLRDLPFAADERAALEASLASYRAGDLPDALASYPTGRPPGSDAERIYYAALLLSVGQVEKTEATVAALLAGDPSDRLRRLGNALRLLIAAVKRQESPSTFNPQLASEFLADSYYQQSRAVRETALRNALGSSRQAAMNSPEFSFAWGRVAELEFSFGRTRQALEALNKSLALSPRNAQALALKGFLLAAQNKTREAIEWFNQAIAVDGNLGNAWLGRGLCRIRRGDRRGGREDLLVAAALEPQRALLRSYLGKAYGDSGDDERAHHELALAKMLDVADPTAWFYSALLLQQENRINQGVDELERSQELNDNRRLYRSRLLLDQDRAVRSANLARLYVDADLGDVALREAGRAVAADYANYSAHLFLANSYESQRRDSLSTLRFEAPAISEYLVASLLGPASGILLAQPITQLEYSRLLESDGFGLIANTEYFSRGAWRHSSAQHGTFKGSSYALDAEYLFEPGQRINQDLEIRQLEALLKHDLTPADSLFFRVFDYRAGGGDTLQHFDESQVARRLRFDEEQTPALVAGYHHQWTPESHTLMLAGRFDDTLDSADPSSVVYALDRQFGATNGLAPVEVRHDYRSRVELYTAEVQQIAVVNRHSMIAGGRLHSSSQKISSTVADPNGMFLILLGTNNPVSVQNEGVSSFTASIYAYDYWRLAEDWQLVGGLNFTHQENPMNAGTSPLSSRREREDRVDPKAGIVWTPSISASVRADYTRSLTGAGIAESARLEPTHVAGLLQSFRDPIPVALAGGADGVDLETAEVVWEQRIRDTHLALGWQHLAAHKNRRLGLFLSNELDYDLPPALDLIRERLDFREEALDVSAHQLVGDGWSFGARYRLSYAELTRSFPEYPNLGVGGLEDRSRWRGWLQALCLTGLYRHRTGLFGRAEGVWLGQEREHQSRSAPDDQFWHANFLVGYRFARQRAEVTAGVLNATGRNYRLDPLNQYPDLPRSRTFYARVLLNF